MEQNRFRICGQANQALKTLKGQTGLTPNILCRMGLCLSLNSEGIPNPEDYEIRGDKDVREFNRYTLFGKEELVYYALFKQWVHSKIKEIDPTTELLEAHLNRGALILAKFDMDIFSLIRK